MCAACLHYCCGSDETDRCGCDGCFEPDCWSEDAEAVDFGGVMRGDVRSMSASHRYHLAAEPAPIAAE